MLSDECEHADTVKGDNTGVDRFEWWRRKVASSNKPSLVAAIMFARVDEVHSDFPEVLGWDPVRTFVQESVVVIDLCKLKLRAILPLGVAILLVKFHGLLVVLGDKNTLHVDVLGTPGT